jgi:hypothetical protein
MDETLDFLVQGVDGLICALTSRKDAIIADLKAEIIRSSSRVGCQVHLIWHGELLDDHRTIGSYDFLDSTILYVNFIPQEFTPKPRPFDNPSFRPLISLLSKKPDSMYEAV